MLTEEHLISTAACQCDLQPYSRLLLFPQLPSQVTGYIFQQNFITNVPLHKIKKEVRLIIHTSMSVFTLSLGGGAPLNEKYYS